MVHISLKKILALFAICALWLSLAEVLVRLIIPLAPRDKEQFKSIFIKSTDEILNYEMRPNFQTILPHLASEKIIYQTNDQGFRDKNFETEKNNTLRVAVIGDSVTFGLGVQEQYTFPQALEKNLKKLDIDAEVLNFGVGGYNSIQEYQQLTTKIAEYHPNLVLLGYSLNDADPNSDWEFDDNLGKLMLKNPPATNNNYLGPLGGRFSIIGPHLDSSRLYWLTRKLLDSIRSPNPKIGDSEEMTRLERLYSNNESAWASRREYLIKMSDQTKKSGSNFLVIIFPLSHQVESPQTNWIAQETVNQYLHDSGIPALDVLPYLKDTPFEPKEIFLDAGHFTETGNVLIAQIITANLFKYNLIPPMNE